MKVVDTNILLRFFVDDPNDAEAQKQKPIADAILSQPVFIPFTVVLEFEWVMRGFYKLPKQQIIEIFRILLSYSHIHFEDKITVTNAVNLLEQNMDFADALHLLQTLNYQGFVTFDNNFYK